MLEAGQNVFRIYFGDEWERTPPDHLSAFLSDAFREMFASADITPAMTEAGVTAFYEHWDDDRRSDPQAHRVIELVLRSALQA
jgi:hypothetical protein